MWWEILPSAGIVYAFLVIPHYIHWASNKIFTGRVGFPLLCTPIVESSIYVHLQRFRTLFRNYYGLNRTERPAKNVFPSDVERTVVCIPEYMYPREVFHAHKIRISWILPWDTESGCKTGSIETPQNTPNHH